MDEIKCCNDKFCICNAPKDSLLYGDYVKKLAKKIDEENLKMSIEKYSNK